MDDKQIKGSRIPAEAVKCTSAPVVVSEKIDKQLHGTVKIVPIEEDGVIRYIEIHCVCGTITVIECVYEGEEK